MENQPYFYPMGIGQNIRKYRKTLGLTQTELAEKLGTTQWLITNYEREVHDPPAAKIPEIAKVLEVSIEELFGFKEKKVPSKAPGRRASQIQKIFNELSPAKQRAVLEHAKGLRKTKH